MKESALRPDFTTTDYLRNGNAIQRKCWKVLADAGIMEILAPFGPVVAGTIPIGVDIPGSDIDILCRASPGDGSAGSFDALELVLNDKFCNYEGFACRRATQNTIPVFVCSFSADGIELEIFAQDVPTTEQNGYRHMITEYELLCRHGQWLREKVVELKLSGVKTEPAFAIALGLEGEPYVAVLEKGRELGVFG